MAGDAAQERVAQGHRVKQRRHLEILLHHVRLVRKGGVAVDVAVGVHETHLHRVTRCFRAS
ncbi:MAG TPA: hypothetical protein VFW14_14980 [Gaiellales bacterium]|nr:hypothetical protein [Gaiellales bacterium]